MATTNWRINLLLAGGVVFTLIMALLMAQLDGLQIQLRPTSVPIANVPFGSATNTPLPAIPLQSATPSPTSTARAKETAVSDSAPIFPSCDQIPSGWVAYTVGANESLSALSIIYNVSVNQISLANCLEMITLIEGMVVYLPSTPLPLLPTPVCMPPFNWVFYQVQPGDTMFSLAVSRGVRVYDVMQANCVGNSYLQAGKFIYLPPMQIVPTNVPTATGTPTSTATLMPTSSATPMATLTATLLPTGTQSPTPTSTETSTPNATPTATISGTITPTATPSSTPIATPTPTATGTSTPSGGTATPTSTETAVSTSTPTLIPTETPTLLPTPTPTP